MSPGDEGPRRIWYWVGGAVALVGIVATVVWIVTGVGGISDQVDDFQRVPVGGEETITLGETGGYTIYYENGDPGDVDVNVNVIGPGIGSGSLGDYDGTLTYTAGGRSGRAVLTLRVDQPGTFTVRATAPDEEGQIAIGRSVGPRLVRTVVGGVLIGLYGVAGATGIVLLTALRRRDARRRS